jgi:hypothetical protein
MFLTKIFYEEYCEKPYGLVDELGRWFCPSCHIKKTFSSGKTSKITFSLPSNVRPGTAVNGLGGKYTNVKLVGSSRRLHGWVVMCRVDAL